MAMPWRPEAHIACIVRVDGGSPFLLGFVEEVDKFDRDVRGRGRGFAVDSIDFEQECPVGGKEVASTDLVA